MKRNISSQYNIEAAELRANGGIVPPSAIELENAILGALLFEPYKLPDISMILQPDDFYEPKNIIVFAEILAMSNRNEPIDLLTISKSSKIKENKIDMPYLVSLTQTVGSAAHVIHHCRIVKQKSIARKLLAMGLEIISQANDESLDVADILTDASRSIDKISEMAVSGKGGRHIKDISNQALKEAEKRCACYARNEPTGITTGISELDRLTGGWQSAQLVILAARPAMGKTSLLIHFAKSAALQGIPVCIYSLEMSDISLSNRLLLSECDVDADDFRKGRLSPIQWGELENAQTQLAKMPIYIDDKASVTMQYIKAHSAIMAKKGQCGLIMCDYLQLADMSTGERGRNREQEVTAASAKAKGIAKELNIPFVLLSQLNRGVEARADKKPMLSDLRESGAIEQDADIVAFIYRPAYYGIKELPSQSGYTINTDGMGILAIAKQRDGATGDIVFRHNPSMTKISDYNSVYLPPSIQPNNKFETHDSSETPF